MNYFLEGKQIGLRAFSKADLPIWYGWFNDPTVTEHMNKGIFPNCIEKQDAFYQAMTGSHEDLQLAVVLKEDETLSGVVGIHNISWVHRHADVSIVIGNKSCWGKGIATKAIALIVEHAFLKMNLRRLTAGTSAKNVASIRCFTKNGFVQEGIKRGHLFKNGIYHDIVTFGLLKNEWGKACKKPK